MSSTYVIEKLPYSATSIVWLGKTQAAILFPPREAGGRYRLYPHPKTYPGLTFEGLPPPLRPEFMSFETLDQVRSFLNIRS